MDVSIIIVNYNTKDLLRNCLCSVLKKTTGLIYEVIVSDNGSTDGSIEMLKKDFPNVVLVENNANLGFGVANNRGLAIAKGKYVFYLNSDTILLNNAVKEFYDYWKINNEKEHFGVLGTMLLDKDGKFNTSYGNLPIAKKEIKYLRNCFLSSVYIKFFYSKFKPVNHIAEYYGEVGYVMGADLFMKNDEFARFDERYFMFYEESDMQYKLQRAGKKSFIIRNPKIIHLEGGSDNRNRFIYNFRKLTSIYYWESCILYLNKNLNAYNASKKIYSMLRVIYLLPWNISKYKFAVSRFRKALEKV